MRFFAFLLLLFAVAVPSWTRSPKKTNPSPAYRSMEQKLEFLETNGQSANPQRKTTTLTADEFTAWLNEGGVRLPNGVSNVKITTVPAVVTAQARVDFDQLTAGVQSSNPLMAVFSGVHDVEVVSQASGAQGVGSVHIDSMKIDGVKVPRVAMQYAVDHYVKPKYPAAGLDTQFELPAKIDTAVVGSNVVTLTQR